MTLREVFDKGICSLRDAGIDEYAVNAEILFEYVFSLKKIDLFFRKDDFADDESTRRYFSLIEKRIKGFPVQLLTETAYFYGLSFWVNENVLIPRFDTEILVDYILKHENVADEKLKFIDMCTGSGCIFISLLVNSAWKSCAVDISDKALEVAADNCRRYNADSRNIFVRSDLFGAFFNNEGLYEDKFDFIVSNPPYIERSVIPTLAEEVKNHEPVIALDGGEDGLDFYRRIVQQCVFFIKKGARIYFEIGYNEGYAVKSILEDSGFENIEIIKDFANLDRCVCAKWSGN